MTAVRRAVDEFGDDVGMNPRSGVVHDPLWPSPHFTDRLMIERGHQALARHEFEAIALPGRPQMNRKDGTKTLRAGESNRFYIAVLLVTVAVVTAAENKPAHKTRR